MDAKLLDLHFAQLKSEWATSKYNNYSDLRKKDYHKKLENVIHKMDKENFYSFTPSEIKQRFHIIQFVFKSLEFLNSSTISTIPFEIVAVLEAALKDWMPIKEYIIVTSLVNGMNEFSFDNYLMFNDFIYRDIELLYKVKFEEKLIQINVPKSTSKDYLANVVLYHELGHFIEKKFEISRVVYLEILDKLNTGNISAGSSEYQEIIKYFPYLDNQDNIRYLNSNYHSFNIFSSHLNEYFCDLFASQYIEDCISHYLNYITQGQIYYSDSHPSTKNRIEFVETFVNDKPSFLLDFFKDTVRRITKVEIQRRCKKLTTDNFEKLIPVEVNDLEELHGLFIYGWDVWLNDWKSIEKGSNLGFHLSQIRTYEIVNNLIEKSIGNYFIKQSWAQSKIL